MGSHSIDRRSVPLALVLVLASLGLWIQAGAAETPEEAIRRIRSGQHVPMPPAATAPASGPIGKGMTIENGTGHTLHVHFGGPVSRTVVVPDGGSAGVELAVGDYHVAAEVPGSRITPFYGQQSYQPLTHYWLKFFTRRVDPPSQPPPRSDRAPQTGGAGSTIELSLRGGSVKAKLPRQMHVNLVGNAGEAVIELQADLSHQLDHIVYVGHFGKMRDSQGQILDYVTPRFKPEELTGKSGDRVTFSGLYVKGLAIKATLRQDGDSSSIMRYFVNFKVLFERSYSRAHCKIIGILRASAFGSWPWRTGRSS